MMQFRRIARAYEAGHLPYAGGILDQPAGLIEAIDFYRSCHGVA